MVETIGRARVLWSAPPTTQTDGHLLVLLHGATSNEHDLFDRLVPLLPAGLVVASPVDRFRKATAIPGLRRKQGRAPSLILKSPR